jgi:Phage tail lysozyme
MGRLQRDLNITPEAATGIAANITAEGATTATGIGKPNGGRGLAQRTGTIRKQFKAWASAQGLDPSAYETQQQLLVQDIKSDYGEMYKQLQDPNLSASDAAKLYNENYEHPANMASDTLATKCRQRCGRLEASRS